MRRALIISGLAALLGGFGVWADRWACAQVSTRLRQAYFSDPSRGSFDRAGVDWLGRRVYVRGVRLAALSGDGWSAEAGAAEVSLPFSWSDLLARRLPQDRLDVSSPFLDVTVSSISVPVVGPAADPPALSDLRASLDRWPVRRIECSNGSIRATWAGAKSMELSRASLALERSESAGLSARAEASLSSDPSALIRFDVRSSSSGDLDGETRLERLPVPLVAGLIGSDPGVAFQSGRLSIATSFNCRKDWLTASHLVELDDFKVAVAPGRKELFGIKTKYLADLFDIDRLSFVVPMTGSVQDPNIGLSSSVEQIMLKLLDAKFKDHEKAVKWARWGGQHFGGKLDGALRRWLEQRRRKS